MELKAQFTAKNLICILDRIILIVTELDKKKCARDAASLTVWPGTQLVPFSLVPRGSRLI